MGFSTFIEINNDLEHKLDAEFLEDLDDFNDWLGTIIQEMKVR
jgi:hypothetical protein